MDEPEVYKILHPVELHSKNSTGSAASKATSRIGGGRAILGQCHLVTFHGKT